MLECHVLPRLSEVPQLQKEALEASSHPPTEEKPTLGCQQTSSLAAIENCLGFYSGCPTWR